MVDRVCPPGWDRVKVSENLGVTAVAPVAPADTSLVNLKTLLKPSFFPKNERNIARISALALTVDDGLIWCISGEKKFS